MIEPGCVIGHGCHIGDRLHLPRGTRLEPGNILLRDPQSPHSTLPDNYAVRDAFDGGALLSPYLSDIGYALSRSSQPEPETAVAFARALAAYAAKQRCSLFLCRAEDTPSLHSLLGLITETLACMTAIPAAVFCADDDVLPLSAARMPLLPLPDQSAETPLQKIVHIYRAYRQKTQPFFSLWLLY